MTMAFLTSCSLIPEERNVQVDYQKEDSRNLSDRSADVYRMTFSITSYSLHTKEFKGVKPNGKGYFFVINYALVNYSDTIRSFDPTRLSLVTTIGDKYSLVNYNNDEFKKFSEPINSIIPDERVTSTAIFEMPSGTETDSLIVGGVSHDDDQIIDVPVPEQK